MDVATARCLRDGAEVMSHEGRLMVWRGLDETVNPPVALVDNGKPIVFEGSRYYGRWSLDSFDEPGGTAPEGDDHQEEK